MKIIGKEADKEYCIMRKRKKTPAEIEENVKFLHKEIDRLWKKKEKERLDK